MSSIENFTYNGLDHQLILSIQGNWPLIGEIGSLLWKGVPVRKMLRLSQYLQSNSFQQQLFNYLKGVCVYVKTSMCARRYHFLPNKKIAIYFDNGDCSMHANYTQISKSIYNTKKVFVILFLPQISSKLWIYTCNYSYTWPSVLLPLETRRKQIVDLWEWIILPNQPTQQTS